MNVNGSRWAALLLVGLLAAAALDAGNPGRISYLWIPLTAAAGAGAILAFSPSPLRRARLFAVLPLLILPALSGLYALNPTHREVRGLGLLPAHPWPGLPGAADAPCSMEAAGIALAVVAVFTLGLCLTCGAFRRLQCVVVAGGALMAAATIQQRLLPRPFPVFEFTGTFVSENHYAAFINLLLPAALAAGERFQFRAAQAGAPSGPAGLCYLAAVLMAASVTLTGSRAGVALMFASLGGWALLRHRVRHSHGHLLGLVEFRLSRLGTIAGVTAAAAAVGITVARECVRGGAVLEELRFRGRLVADTVSILQAHPLWGTGPGTFASVFPYYRSDPLGANAVSHAHCEPVQFFAEFGWLGVALILLAVGLAIPLCRRALAAVECREHPRCREIEIPALKLALGVLAIHGLLDFPLRMPVIALVAALWLSRLCLPRDAGVRQAAPLEQGSNV